MKYLYQELQAFKTELSSTFENEHLKELENMTDNFYFEEVLGVCEEIAQLKTYLKNLGHKIY
jgi:hypothetical protein